MVLILSCVFLLSIELISGPMVKAHAVFPACPGFLIDDLLRLRKRLNRQPLAQPQMAGEKCGLSRHRCCR